MKLAEDGDDWGMAVTAHLHPHAQLNQSTDARLEEDELWKLRMQGL
jgi:hypothetical protein